MVVYKDNASASNAMHAIRSGSVSAAVDAGIKVEWLQTEGAQDPAASAAGGSATPSTNMATTPACSSEAGDSRGHETVHLRGENDIAGSQPDAAAARAAGGSLGQPSGHAAADETREGGGGGSSAGGGNMPSFSSWQPGAVDDSDSILSHRDYESITLMRSCPTPLLPPPSLTPAHATPLAHRSAVTCEHAGSAPTSPSRVMSESMSAPSSPPRASGGCCSLRATVRGAGGAGGGMITA